MIKEIDINGVLLEVDKESTQVFYQTQTLIVDDCSCEHCAYYANTFIKQPHPMLQLLEELGIDLSKNLASEPTGVWCIMDEPDTLITCVNEYQVVGQITSEGVKEFSYALSQNGIIFTSLFTQWTPDIIQIQLTGAPIS